MNKPIIIVGEQGSGKTRSADALMQALGCSRLVDDWDGVSPLEAGDLALTSRHDLPPQTGRRVMSLEQALLLLAP